VHKAWNSVPMSTNFVASTAELEVIKQWLRKVTGLNVATIIEPCLLQSKSFLKILDVPYYILLLYLYTTTSYQYFLFFQPATFHFEPNLETNSNTCKYSSLYNCHICCSILSLG